MMGQLATLGIGNIGNWQQLFVVARSAKGHPRSKPKRRSSGRRRAIFSPLYPDLLQFEVVLCCVEDVNYPNLF